MEERIKRMTTTEELVAKGTALNGRAEMGISDAMKALQELGEAFIQGYTIGAIKGGAALKYRDQYLSLVGKLAEIHSEVIDLHIIGTELAEKHGIPPTQPYAELPQTDARDGGR